MIHTPLHHDVSAHISCTWRIWKSDTKIVGTWWPGDVWDKMRYHGYGPRPVWQLQAPGWTPLLKSSLFSLWRQILQKIDKVFISEFGTHFLKEQSLGKILSYVSYGLNHWFQKLNQCIWTYRHFAKSGPSRMGEKIFFFVGQTKKIECNFTTKFIGFIKYTAMKTILLASLTCNIFVANHSQPGTSLRSQKLWFICVKHVINSGVQPPRQPGSHSRSPRRWTSPYANRSRNTKQGKWN